MGKKAIEKGAALLAALDASYARSPDRKVEQVMEEARLLIRVVKDEGKKLLDGTRIDKKLLRSLPDRGELLEEMDARWARELGQRAKKPARKAAKEAEALRADMVAALRYFLDGDAGVQAQVDVIQEGSGLADLVDDLGKLAGLVERHARSLEKAGLDGAPVRARELADLLGETRAAERSEAAFSDALGLRNRAFWYLREAMDEIRAAGRYAFRHDSKALVAFRASTTSRPKPSVAPSGGTTPVAVAPTSR